MPDLDALVVAFQTQLSDVMETVVKTAMFEVTRLVEDVFLVEVRRRRRELESLRMQLQRNEEQFRGDKARSKTLLESSGNGVDQAGDCEETGDCEEDTTSGCDVKTPRDSVGCWMSSLRRDDRTGAEDEAAAAQNPDPDQQAAKPEDQMSTLDVKEEEVNAPCCSSHHLSSWGSTFDDRTGPESSNACEAAEVRPKKAEENGDDFLKSSNRQDSHISAAYQYPEDQPEARSAADQPHFSSLELDTGWIGLPGLLQSHRPDKECDPVKSKGSAAREEPEVCDSVRADVQLSLGADPVSSSGSPEARMQHSSMLGVAVKKEALISSGGSEPSERAEKKFKKPGRASASDSGKPHRVILETHKFNSSYNKGSVLEGMKPQSKVDSGLSLHEAIEHIHRPLKKPPSVRTSASPSVALSLVGNLSNSNRIPSTSKAAPSAALSVQRLHLNRTNASWVGLKSQLQPATCQHSNPAPHAESHPHIGSRHLLRCGQCGKCFPHPSNLKAHLQTHTGERPFCCSLCGRSFTKLSNLKAHRRVHTGERPYCCLACGKRFTQKCNLKRHQRIHLDV
ncbi:zinc finger protein 697-like [Oryzias latipes]|uniref:C2H2-type domain-containing protein n=1 Tax=Oryzias latipes TaxID=8090 RepID=A0A3B3HBN2_ORYLA|nr:zinc finger protein 697-like [Oryzias latipes]